MLTHGLKEFAKTIARRLLIEVLWRMDDLYRSLLDRNRIPLHFHLRFRRHPLGSDRWLRPAVRNCSLRDRIDSAARCIQHAMLSVLLLNCGRRLDLSPIANAFFFCRPSAVWESCVPSGNTSLALARLILPSPVLSRWESRIATGPAVCNIHVARFEALRKLTQVLFIAEMVFPAMPSFGGAGLIPVAHHGLVPIAIVLPAIVQTGHRRTARKWSCR